MSTLRLTAAGVVCLLGSVFAAPAEAQIGSNGVMYACVRIDEGGGDAHNFRLVPAGEACKKNETRVQWNVVGAPGPQGPAGPQGSAGPQGPIGPQGLKGDGAAPPARKGHKGRKDPKD